MRGVCFTIGFLALQVIPQTADGIKICAFITVPTSIALMAFAGGFDKSIRKLKEYKQRKV